jgi:hypothetical protein
MRRCSVSAPIQTIGTQLKPVAVTTSRTYVQTPALADECLRRSCEVRGETCRSVPGELGESHRRLDHYACSGPLQPHFKPAESPEASKKLLRPLIPSRQCAHLTRPHVFYAV